MATGRRRGRAIIYIALILIALIVLAFVLLRSGLLGPSIATTPGQSGGGTAPLAAATATSIPEKVKIFVVSQEIKRGQEIGSDRVVLTEIDREEDSEDFFHETDARDVIGSRAVVDMRPSDPLKVDMVALRGEDAGIPSFEIPSGMVAISIPVSRLSAVSYGLQKGDHVNVLVSMLFLDLDTNWQSKLPNRTGLMIGPGPVSGEDQVTVTSIISSGDAYNNTPFNGANSYFGRIEIEPAANSPVWTVPGEESRPRLVSQTLIQDVMILQTGYFGQDMAEAVPVAEGTPAPEAEVAGEQVAAAPKAPEVVTLVVTPQDAVTLNYLLLSGAQLNLVLRSAGDFNRVDTEAVTLQFLMDQYRIPNPAKLPYGTEPRVDGFPDFVPVFPEPGPSPTPGG